MHKANYTLFYIKTSNFGAEAERSCIIWRRNLSDVSRNPIKVLALMVLKFNILKRLRPVQTLETLLANKTQHCWAQHHVVCCCDLLEVVG